MAARHGRYPPESRERAVRAFASSSVVPQTVRGALGCGRSATVSGSVCGTADATPRPITHRPTFPATYGHAALNSAFGSRSPKMPGDPMRVQPSRAKKPADTDA
jgi:hypothetical protein